MFCRFYICLLGLIASTISLLPSYADAAQGTLHVLESVTGEWERTEHSFVFARCKDKAAEPHFSVSGVYIKCKMNDGSRKFLYLSFTESGKPTEETIGTFSDTVNVNAVSAGGRFLVLNSNWDSKSPIKARVYDSWHKQWSEIPVKSNLFGITISDAGEGTALLATDSYRKFTVIDWRGNVLRDVPRLTDPKGNEVLKTGEKSGSSDWVSGFSPDGKSALVISNLYHKKERLLSQTGIWQVRDLLGKSHPSARLVWSAMNSKRLAPVRKLSSAKVFRDKGLEKHLGVLLVQDRSHANSPSDFTTFMVFSPYLDLPGISMKEPLTLKYSENVISEVELNLGLSPSISAIGYQTKSGFFMWDGTELSDFLPRASLTDSGGFLVPGETASFTYAAAYNSKSNSLDFYRAPATLKRMQYEVLH